MACRVIAYCTYYCFREWYTIYRVLNKVSDRDQVEFERAHWVKANQQARAIVIMGVSGCGKSTVGMELARRLEMAFVDADELHPQSNIDKMSQSIPLSDDDRWPWLERVGQALAQNVDQFGGAVVACSALRLAYRECITLAAAQPVLFVHLAGSYATIAERLTQRAGHFMPAQLLKSQFETLESPTEDELAIEIDIRLSVDQIVDRVIQLRT